MFFEMGTFEAFLGALSGYYLFWKTFLIKITQKFIFFLLLELLPGISRALPFLLTFTA